MTDNNALAALALSSGAMPEQLEMIGHLMSDRPNPASPREAYLQMKETIMLVTDFVASEEDSDSR